MAKSGSVTPIIVLGSARNGTTWLCNLLAEQPEIAAAQHEAHWGFHESNVYKNHRYWGALGELDRRIHFLRVYCGADHFRLVEGDAAALEAEITRLAESGRAADFYDAFFFLMDSFASRSGRAHWVTKLDPLVLLYPREFAWFLHRLRERYQRVALVSIKRDITSVVQSYLNMEGRATQRRTSPARAPLFAILAVARNLVHYRSIRRAGRTYPMTSVTYHDLRSDPHGIVRTICRSAGVAYSRQAGASRYAPNSSMAYKDGALRLGTAARAAIRGVVVPLLVVLWPLTVALVRRRERFRDRRPPVYFKLHKLERYPEAFGRELREQGDTALARRLFGEQ